MIASEVSTRYDTNTNLLAGYFFRFKSSKKGIWGIRTKLKNTGPYAVKT